MYSLTELILISAATALVINIIVFVVFFYFSKKQYAKVLAACEEADNNLNKEISAHFESLDLNEFVISYKKPPTLH